MKIFQHSHVLSVSVGNSYYEDQLIHIFLVYFHQSGKYTAQIEREETFTDLKLYLFHLYRMNTLILTAVRVMVETISNKVWLRQNSPLMEVITILLKKLKRYEIIRINLARVIIWTNNKMNLYFANVLDTDM